MSSTYSTNLRLELIGTGDQAGVWGATTNNNMGTLLDQAIAGYTTVTCSTTSTVLTVNNALSDQSRPAVLVLSGTPGAAFSVFAPPGVSKTYIICNSVSTYTATIYLSTTLGGTTPLGTGIAIPAGKTLQVWTDGATGFFSVNAPGTIAQLTMNTSGAGAVSGSVYDGSVAQTISYNSIGAFPSAGGSVSGYISASSYIAIENANPLRLFSTLNAGYVDIYNNSGVVTTSADIYAGYISGSAVAVRSGAALQLFNSTNSTYGSVLYSGGKIVFSLPYGGTNYSPMCRNVQRYTGGNGTIYADQGCEFLAIDCNLTSATIVFPPSAVDGQKFAVGLWNSYLASGISWSYSGYNVSNPPTSLSYTTAATWIFVAATSSWFRVS